MVTLIRVPAPNVPHQRYAVAQEKQEYDDTSNPLAFSSSSSCGKLQCCVCLDICASIMLRPACLHQFCNSCFKNEFLLCHNDNKKCPACRTKKKEPNERAFLDDKIKLITVQAQVIASAPKEINTIAQEIDCQEHTGEPVKLLQGINRSIVVTPQDVPKGRTQHKRICEENDVSNKNKKRTSLGTDASLLVVVPAHGSAASKRCSFEERCEQLLEFRKNNGHCNVHYNKPDNRNPALEKWCTEIRRAYNNLNDGKKKRRNLSKDRIERLEEIGFKWTVGVGHCEVFDKHCRDLEAFKSKYGHCSVMIKDINCPSLGNWCSKMRSAYKKIQNGEIPVHNLSQDRMDRLEKIGFKWEIFDPKFERCCQQLEEFKIKFGHCNVPNTYNPLLGKWCLKMRIKHNKIKKGEIPECNMMNRLGTIGLNW